MDGDAAPKAGIPVFYSGRSDAGVECDGVEPATWKTFRVITLPRTRSRSGGDVGWAWRALELYRQPRRAAHLRQALPVAPHLRVLRQLGQHLAEHARGPLVRRLRQSVVHPLPVPARLDQPRASQVGEVAERVEYQSASAFSTAFTRLTGRPPSEFARSTD